MLTVLFGSFVILILIGCPIAVTLGASSVAALLMDGSFDLGIAIQRMFTGVNSFPLMAIPFFMLAGSLMELGGISSRIIRFADTLVGHYRGGLAFAAIIACMIFASISGSAVATVAAIGGIIIPKCGRKYPDGYSTAVVTAAGTMGPIIPPSTTFVIYASIAGVSVSDMFLGGYIPGILMGISLMIVLVSKRGNESSQKPQAVWERDPESYKRGLSGLAVARHHCRRHYHRLVHSDGSRCNRLHLLLCCRSIYLP